MITNDFTICKTNIEINTMLKAQDINNVIKLTVFLLLKYGFDKINFKLCVRDFFNVS